MVERRPRFLIIGSPKCGTTALAQYLSSHPQVFLSRPKEPHFFDSARHRAGLERYLTDHFAAWRDEAAAGEATPSSLHVPWVPGRVRMMLPDARLIALLRNPVERSYSSWWMLYVRGMESLPFEDAIAAERNAPPTDQAQWDAHLAALQSGAHIKVRTYLASGDYATHLRRWLDVFPREQLRAVFSEELNADAPRVIRALWQFLGVDEDCDIGDKGRVNEALGPAARPLLSVLRATGLMSLRGMVPGRLRNLLKMTLSTAGKAPAMRAETRAMLIEEFSPSVQALESMLSVNLAAWRR